MGWIRSIFAALGLANDRKPVTFDADDEAMAQAMREARATFPQFVERLEAPQEGDENFLVKVHMSDGEGNFESLWTEKPDHMEGVWAGTLVNVPNLVSYTLGERITFCEEDVADWCYWHNGKLQGGYTYAVMLATLPESERAKVRKQLGID